MIGHQEPGPRGRFARDHGERGRPGFIVTDMTDALTTTRKALMDQVPLGRLGSPDDVAHAVAFLASPQAAYITGETSMGTAACT